MVRKGCNKAGRFLEVAVEADGGRNGTIWIPEGRKGWGWRCMLEFPPLPGKRVEIEELAVSGLHYGQSFVSVLRSRVGGLKRLS